MQLNVREASAIAAGLKLLKYGLQGQAGFFPVHRAGNDEISREYHDEFQSKPLTIAEIDALYALLTE